MWWRFFLLILAAVLHQGDCDCYGHSPRFSNNRLDGQGRARTTNNRLCDTQNNNRAGYNVGGGANRKQLLTEIYQKAKKINKKGVRAEWEEKMGPEGKMKYYEGSVLHMTWTNQHECGGDNTKCEVVVQYMCDDKLRDGIEDKRIPDNANQCDIGEDQKTKSCDDDRRYGLHEDHAYYTLCRNTQRNTMLYAADQELSNRHTAKHTRQNRNGNRNGYECPEERDYYPYWRPSPWVDIAIMTDDMERCEMYRNESENVKPRYFCKVPDAMIQKLIQNNKQGLRIPITEEGCKKFTHEGHKGAWVRDERPLQPAPQCLPNTKSRDNHHGNKADGFFTSFNWTIPNTPHSHCALRLRYNITTSETPWEYDQSPALSTQFQEFQAVGFRCAGKRFCCSSKQPCYLGDGHCLSHSQCRPGLICGSGNSPLDRTTNLCMPDEYQIRSVEGATLVSAIASTVHAPQYQPELAFTGRSRNGMYGYFHSRHEENPWVRLQIKPYLIKTLTLINRWDCCGERLRNVEIRAGRDRIMFSNPIVGTFDGPGFQRGEYVIPFTTPTETEYITIQIKHRDRQFLQINGIKINEPTGVQCPENDLEFYKQDLRREDNIGSWEDCGKKCSERSDCKAWSWLRARQQCYLKKDTYMIGRSRNLATVSGVRGCVGSGDSNDRKRRDISASDLEQLEERFVGLSEKVIKLRDELKDENDAAREVEKPDDLLKLDEEMKDEIEDEVDTEDLEEKYHKASQQQDDEYQQRQDDVDTVAMLRDAHQDKTIEKREGNDPIGDTESFGPFNIVDEEGGLKLQLADDDAVEELKKCAPSERSVETDLSFTVQRQNSKSKSYVRYLRSDQAIPDLTAERALKKSTLLTTLPKLGKAFRVSFEVNPSKFRWGWTSILHLTTGNNCCQRGNRIPAVWFKGTRPTDTTDNLYICSAVNWNGNQCYTSPKNIQRGQWTRVEISQQPEGENYRYKITIGGNEVDSRVNPRAAEYNDVKVYASDPWHNVAQGSIRNLVIDTPVDVSTFTFNKGTSEFTELSYDGQFLKCSGLPNPTDAIEFLEQRPILQGTLLYTIPKFGKEYSVRFQVNPTKFRRGWSDAIHLTTGKNCCGHGDRIPVVLFETSSENAATSKMHVCSSVNNRGNKCVSTPNIPRGQWTDVEVKQYLKGEDYKYEVSVNGNLIGESEVNGQPREFEDVKVYASGPQGWHYNAEGFIKNLVILGRTSTSQCQDLPVNVKVPAVIVGLDFHPQSGQAPNDEWERNKYSISGRYYKMKCQSGFSKDVTFGPYHQEEEDGGLKVEFVGQLNTEVLKSCPAAHRRIKTDVSFAIQREDSSSYSTVKYMRFRPDAGSSDVETFSLSEGQTDFTKLTYDGKFLTCTGRPGDDGIYDFPNEVPIKKNTKITTIPRLGKTFSVKFEVRPIKFENKWTNVLHMTTGGNCCGYGQRIPAVHFEPTSGNKGKMYVCFSVNSQGNHCYATEKNVPVNQWTSVMVEQYAEGDAYRYKVSVNGNTIGSVLNRDAREFDEFEAWSSYQWSLPTSGSIRKLRIEGGIPNTQCQNLPVNEKVEAVVVSIDFNPRNGETVIDEWDRNRYSLNGSHYNVECQSGDEVCSVPGQECWNGACRGDGEARSCECEPGTSPNEQDICVLDDCGPGYEKNSLGYCALVGLYNAPPRCRGEDNNCCTDDHPCENGEGDCDEDSQCAGSLICGFNNCYNSFGASDDCCTNNPLVELVGGDPFELKKRGYKFQNDPTVRPLKLVHEGEDIGKLLELDIALNTAQTGRTFQDRSHAFSILNRTADLAGKKIYNMEVRGKRGNIVQVYPSTEYDYTPNRLNVEEGDMVHIQWTGSDRNPQNNDGNGQRGTDRSNLVLLREQTYIEGIPGKAVPLELKNGHWGSNYPNDFINSEGKSLMALERKDQQKLALVNDVDLIPENELLSNLPAINAVSGPTRDPRLDLSCPSGRKIRVVSALFGGTVCNGASGIERCAKCIGRKSMEQVKKICDHKERCTVHAHRGQFSHSQRDCPRDIDPKLKVSYKCLKFSGKSYLDLNPSSHYFNLPPRSMSKIGEFKYMCTRNNDFTNRSHKGKIKVSPRSK